ncbi:MAG: hypothetical protein M1816_007220 [Peltula sp. TS41687]|nr:MAG: hypothetical protein M1816_007220 [Peltula sp. TS41687]
MQLSTAFKGPSKKVRGFDQETGQVFTETTMPEPTMAMTVPHNRPLGEERRRATYKNPLGAASLASAALRKIKENSQLLTADHLRHVPWLLGSKIWNGIEWPTFEQWDAFVSVYVDAPYEEIQYRETSIDAPRLPLESYINPPMCQSLQWVTLLSISFSKLSRVDVVNLVALRNLAGLDLTAATNTPRDSIHNWAVSDSVLRSWSRSVEEDGAFPNLRVLGVKGWEGVTMRSAVYVSNFPALVEFDVEDTQITRADFDKSGLKGWEVQPILWMSPFDQKPWPSTLHYRYKMASERHAATAGQEGAPVEPDIRPAHHVTLGCDYWTRDYSQKRGLSLQRTEEVLEDSASSDPPPPQEEVEQRVGGKRKRAGQESGPAKKQIRRSKRQTVEEILGNLAGPSTSEWSTEYQKIMDKWNCYRR